jgi:hypothetical protein
MNFTQKKNNLLKKLNETKSHFEDENIYCDLEQINAFIGLIETTHNSNLCSYIDRFLTELNNED